jgi:hypothetical protein
MTKVRLSNRCFFLGHIPTVAQLATLWSHWLAIWLHEVKNCQNVWLLAK